MATGKKKTGGSKPKSKAAPAKTTEVRLPQAARGLKKLLDALVKNKHTDWLPRDYPVTTVQALVDENVAAVSGRTVTKGERHTTSGDRRSLERRAAKLVTDSERIVDGDFPNGATGRADFFPSVNPKETLAPLLVDRLRALANGFRKHPVSGVPSRLSPAALDKAALELAGLSQSSEALTDSTHDAAKGRPSLLHRTRDARRRIAVKVRGILGSESSDLATYGLKPLVPRAHRSKKPQKPGPVTPPTSP